jgi:hypothetical protein
MDATRKAWRMDASFPPACVLSISHRGQSPRALTLGEPSPSGAAVRRYWPTSQTTADPNLSQQRAGHVVAWAGHRPARDAPAFFLRSVMSTHYRAKTPQAHRASGESGDWPGGQFSEEPETAGQEHQNAEANKVCFAVEGQAATHTDQPGCSFQVKLGMERD